MHFLENGSDFVGSNFISLDSSWLATAVPHMCRIAPSTASGNSALRTIVGNERGPGEHLNGPVLFDSKYELYATALNELFGMNVYARATELKLILFPQFHLEFDGFEL